MFKHKIYILIALSVLCAITEANAQNAIGKIDIRRVMLLHPAMINYSPVHKAFKIERDENAKKAAKQESKEAEEEIAALKLEMESLKKAIGEENKEYDHSIDILQKKHQDDLMKKSENEGATEASKVIYSVEASRMETNHTLKLTAFFNKYSMAEDKLLKLTQFGYDEKYTTPLETEKQFNSILSEIKATIKKIADQRGINVVLNTGYKRIIKESGKNIDYSAIDDNNSLGSIFKNPLPEKLTNDELAVAGYYSNLNNSVKIWLRDADPLLNRINSDLIDTDIIMGGVDLTQEVLKTLYDKYKIDPSIGNAVIQSALIY